VDCKHYVLFNFLLSKPIGCPSCINIAPILKLDASHLMMKGLEKSNVANTGVVDIMFFKFSKHFCASKSHWKEFLLRRFVKGVIK
jgi:hypothetical protein